MGKLDGWITKSRFRHCPAGDRPTLPALHFLGVMAAQQNVHRLADSNIRAFITVHFRTGFVQKTAHDPMMRAVWRS